MKKLIFAAVCAAAVKPAYTVTVPESVILILNQQLEINETLWYNKKG